MKLSNLIKSGLFEGNNSLLGKNPDITSIHFDSRDVLPGGLFVAITGITADGNRFIPQALENGAVAIITENTNIAEDIKQKTIVIKTTNARKALAEVASYFYGNGDRAITEDLFMIAITGTNGKTTITYILEKILNHAGLTTGVIGTINYRYGDKCFPNPRTTPESLDLQRIFREMKDNGVTHVIMEVSSHAIDLDRVWKCHFDIAAFTNLTQDHLDYHEDLDSYFKCKKRLFTEYLTMGPKAGRTTAIINTDDPKGAELVDSLNVKTIKTGTLAGCDIQAESFEITLKGIQATVKTGKNFLTVNSTLVGRFNLENILISIGVALALHIKPPVIEKAISDFDNTPGRMNSIKNNKNRYVFVDYAHTPDALENVLSTLKDLATGKIISIFGCGGDRDNSKRAEMGRIGCRYSDISIITSDNPRTEDPHEIISDIRKGIPEEVKLLSSKEADNTKSAQGYMIIEDRESAISTGIKLSEAGDTILIAGKGHEDYQIIGTEKKHFDDSEEAEKALMER